MKRGTLLAVLRVVLALLIIGVALAYGRDDPPRDRAHGVASACGTPVGAPHR